VSTLPRCDDCPDCGVDYCEAHLTAFDLDAILRRAREAFDALTPEQQAAHRREQAIDWAYGQLMATTRHRTGITRELVADAYDKSRGAPTKPFMQAVIDVENERGFGVPSASQPSKGSE
jgi:hypothetical protein